MSDTTKVWTVLSMLEWATSYFEDHKVKTPRLSIEWLLAHVLKIKRLDLYLKFDRPLTKSELEELRPLVKRRATHEPLQYITGETSFFNSELKVNPSVLIPRQETEQLVQLILDEHKEEELSVLDIGTGSGCIPIALKKERHSWNISAFDISEEALVIANENTELNNVELNLFKHSLFDPELKSENKFDIIISNPPYILKEESDGLDQEVVDYEPHEALFCSNTKEMYSALEIFCSKNLKTDGVAYFEIHEEYGEEVRKIFKEKDWGATVRRDLSEKSRFVTISSKK